MLLRTIIDSPFHFTSLQAFNNRSKTACPSGEAYTHHFDKSRQKNECLQKNELFNAMR